MMSDEFDRVIEREREERRRRRRRRARRVFRVHATVFVAVNTALFVAWLTGYAIGSTAAPWFLPTLLGWGAGLAVHRYAIRRAYEPSGGPGPQPSAASRRRT